MTTEHIVKHDIAFAQQWKASPNDNDNDKYNNNKQTNKHVL